MGLLSGQPLLQAFIKMLSNTKYRIEGNFVFILFTQTKEFILNKHSIF
jgi:hypothetical protein